MFLQVLDTDILPCFPYRDDGILLYQAMEKYVSSIVFGNYGKNLLLHQQALQITSAKYLEELLKLMDILQAAMCLHLNLFKACKSA